MSKIKKITVSNLKAVSSLTVDFNGCTAIITGGNNKGKSSFLKSLPERLRGNKPDLILKQGEKDGFAEWELTTGEKFLWEFNGKKEKLTFTSERNIKSSISKDLSTYYFPPVFDVDEFLNSTPAKQKKELQKLTGIDFTEIDRLYKEAYETRAYANKRVQEEKVKHEANLVDPLLPKEITPTAELEIEFAGIEVHNGLRKNKIDLVKQKENSVTENAEEIIRLKNLIKSIEQKNSVFNYEIMELEVWLDAEINQIKGEKETADLTEKLLEIRLQNRAIEENKKAIHQTNVYDTALLDAENADREVKLLEAEKLDVIKNSTMPEGFGFDEEGITYKGYQFNKEQLSSSGIYIAALKLAALGLGEVKALHFDASFLDKNSLGEIEAWANESNLQLLIERPDFEGGEIEYQLIAN